MDPTDNHEDSSVARDRVQNGLPGAYSWEEYHPPMPTDLDTDLARSAVSDALDSLLVALVALHGTGDVEVPAEALDLAMRSDPEYQQASGAWRTVFTDLGDVLHRDPLFFELEEKHTAVVSAATDVGFRLGLAIASTSKE